MEEILTIFIGRSISRYTAKYHGKFPWERVTITEHPLSFVKYIFKRKFVDVPILMGLDESIEYKDFPDYDAISGEMTGIKVRVVFADLHLNKNLAILEKIPALERSQDIIKNLQIQLDVANEKFHGLISAIEELDDDIAKKKILEQAHNIQEIKKKTYTFGDQMKPGGRY